MIAIQELINKTIRDEQEEKEIKSWHPSGLGGCLRGLYFQRLGVEPDREFDDRTLRVFKCGKMFEDFIVDLIKKQKGFEIREQSRINDPTLNVSGYSDLFIKRGREEKLYEIKSKHSRAFWYMNKEGKPMRQHEYQLWIYLYLLNIKKGAILYVSKDDLSIAEFPVDLGDVELKNEVLSRINLLNRAWKLKDPSILPLPASDSWKAKYCRFHSLCKQTGGEEEESKIKTINDYISLFAPINPSFKAIYKKKGQRDAVARMLKDLGAKRLEASIVYLRQISDDPFAPAITTPIQLENKMGNLLLYRRRRRKSDEKEEVKVVVPMYAKKFK